MNVNQNEFLYVEKYRPSKIEDCILPKSIKSTMKDILAKGELPNMLFSGGPGVGKTTVAKALCKELDLDYILINGSEEGNIDVLRGKIKQFASTVSFQGGYKVVILDEADYLNCLSEDESILLSDGELMSLKEMRQGQKYDVISFNTENREYESDVAEVVNEDMKEVFEIELEDGRKVEVTADHPFMVIDSTGKISERSINDGFVGYEIICMS